MCKEKLKGRNFAWVPFAILIITAILVVIPPIHGDFNPAADIQDPNSQIYLDQLVYEFDSPPTDVGDKFNVTVVGYNISQVFAYQVVIDYDATLLSCINAWPDQGVFPDPDWVFSGLQTWGLMWTSYADAPSVGRNAELVGDSLKNPGDEVNLIDPASEAILARFEFEILAVPGESEELSCVLSITSSWAAGTYVQSSDEALALKKRSPNLTNSEYVNISSITPVTRPPQMYMDQLWYNFTSPPLKAGTKFTVDVYSYNISALYAYQVVILYNASLLNCTNAWPNIGWDDSEWVFNKYGAGGWGLTMWTHYEGPVGTLPSGFNAELVGDVHSEYSNVSLAGIEALMARFEFEILLDPPSYGEYTCLLDLTDVWMGGTAYATRDEPDVLLSPDLTNSNFNIKWVVEALPSDLDGDGVVGIADLSIAAQAFGSFPGHPRWNPIADLNKDGWVDISDIVEIAVDFGKII